MLGFSWYERGLRHARGDPGAHSQSSILETCTMLDDRIVICDVQLGCWHLGRAESYELSELLARIHRMLSQGEYY